MDVGSPVAQAAYKRSVAILPGTPGIDGVRMYVYQLTMRPTYNHTCN